MKELMQKRRSIRKYTEATIEKEKIEQLIRAVMFAPTSRNTKAWEFILVDDKEILGKLAAAKKGAHFLASATLGIVILADPGKSDVWIEDASIAAIVLQLQAQDLGLGSCWIQIRERMYEEGVSAGNYVKEILSIPDNLQVEAIVSLGYPAETRPEHTDNDLIMDKIHWNKY